MCVNIFTGKFVSFVCGRLFYDRYLLYKCNHVYQCSDSRLHNMYYAGHVVINLRTLCYSCFFFLPLPFTTVRSSVWSIVSMTYYLTIRLSARFRHDLPGPLWWHFRLVDCGRPLKATSHCFVKVTCRSQEHTTGQCGRYYSKYQFLGSVRT